MPIAEREPHFAPATAAPQSHSARRFAAGPSFRAASLDFDVPLGVAPIGVGLISVVALLVPCAVDVTVAATGHRPAPWRAPVSAVGGQVVAIVALLATRLPLAVPAIGAAAMTAGQTSAVATVVHAVVADLVAVEDAVTAHRRAEGRLRVGRCR